MIIENQAVDLADGAVDPAHKIQILCPKCKADVNEQELQNKVCGGCGASLNTPEQHIELHVTSIPLFAITFS